MAEPLGLTAPQRFLKRGLDVTAAAVGLIVTSPIVLLAWAAASIDTGASGFFRQERIGLHGRSFRVVKLRTMRLSTTVTTTVSTTTDPRITVLGRLVRRAKIDELPQLWNVFVGDMSLVGPRPDVPGFADTLVGDDRLILSVRPGITGPATLKFRNEEQLLAAVDDPERYNREVIFQEKVRLNREYVQNYSFRRDISYIVRTVIGR